MKPICTFLIISSLVACSDKDNHQSAIDCNQPDNENLARRDSLAILENFERQATCWNNQDLECYVRAYDTVPEVQTVSRAGRTKGIDNILADYQRYFRPENMGRLNFDEIEMKRLSNQYYYVVGRFNLYYEVPDTTIRGWFSVLMEKKDNHWLMISDHSS